MRSKFGKYEIKSELGRGAMGIVYLAYDSRLGRPVALKTMFPSVAGDPELLRRFYREAQSAAQLRHPNIVTIYDIDEADGIPFIAMEFLEGESLEKVIVGSREVGVVKKLDIIIQTCRGLQYAHQHGIVHRDMKPANIVLLNDGQAKIVDFGIARIGSASLTRTGMVMGTPMYMSPEQIQGQAVDARSDIFSMGVILYELLSHKNPFASADVSTVLYRILNEPPALLSSIIPECPPQLDQVTHRAMERNREERFQAIEDMAFELQRVADSLKRETLDLYMEQGQRSIQEGDLTHAKEALQKILEIDSSYNLAKALLDEVQKKIYTRERAQKIEQLLAQSQQALQSQHYDEAVAGLDEILKLDPGHAEAAKLRRAAAEQRGRRQKIDAYIERAERLAVAGDFSSAKLQLESALGLDSRHAAALKMMERVTKELDHQKHLQQVRESIESARSLLARKNFAEAIDRLDQARELDPLNIEVETLLNEARSGEELAKRRQALFQLTATVQEAMDREEYEHALELANQGLQKFPDNTQLIKLHAQVSQQLDTQEKRRLVEEHLQAARESVQKNQYLQALDILERALEVAPNDSRLTSFLRSVQEAQARTSLENQVQQAMHQANESIREKDFSAAIMLLERVEVVAGHSSEVDALLKYAREQKEEEQHRERIRRLLSRAQACLREEAFEEAVRILEQREAELKSTEVDALLVNAREEWKKFEQRREKILQQARKFRESGEISKAVALLETAPKTYFKNTEFQSYYAQCRQGWEESNFIRRTLGRVEQHIASEELAEARQLLQKALQSRANDPELLAEQRRLREEEARLHETELRKILSEAEVALGRLQYAEAIKILSSVSWDTESSPGLAARAKTLLKGAQEGKTKEDSRETAVYGTAPAKGVAAPLKSARQVNRAGGPAAPSGEMAPQAGSAPRLPASSSTVQGRGAASVAIPSSESARRLVGLVVGVALLLMVLVGLARWRFYVRPPTSPGRVELSVAPWAAVVNVSTVGGKSLGLSGQTPMQLQLPAGDYVIELKNDKMAARVNVSVEPSKVVTINYQFPDMSITQMVDDLVTKY